MTDLHGKRVLMFYPYGATKHYGEAIKNELISRGCIVASYDERPSQKALTKIVIRLFKNKIPQIFDSYVKRVINENRQTVFDYILICRGEAFTPKSIKLIKSAFPKSKVIFYFWDIFACADLRVNIPYVEKAMSFDPEDVANNPGLQFRPTFFVNEYRSIALEKESESKYDILFIGTLHSKRHKILKKMREVFTKQGLKLFYYLYIPSILVYIKDSIEKFPYVRIQEVHFSPISMLDTVKLLNNCKAILDINFSSQKSLSMRAYESMAAHKKYITTNPEVKKYDFYNPNNIAIIDIDNLIIPEGFLDTPFEPVPEHILYHYSVQGLVDNLFS